MNPLKKLRNPLQSKNVNYGYECNGPIFQKISMKQYYKDWIKNGNSNLDHDEAIKLRKQIEGIIELKETVQI